MKIVGIADTDSYLKWAAAVLDDTPAGWAKELVLLATPACPSASQIDAALAGTKMKEVRPFELANLAKHIAAEQPSFVLLGLTGPAVRVVVRAIVRAVAVAGGSRPVFFSGMPGISFPATRRALLYRSQVDLLLVHSKRERADFARVAEELGLEQRLGLASLAFLGDTDRIPVPVADRNVIVFATQAKVPRLRSERLEILEWLRMTALLHPGHRVVIKLRARDGEKQTHAERHPYDALAAELGEFPENLSFETGSMGHHLATAAALVTVSSTAALEAAVRGIPALILNDFGVSARLINLVFEGSGLLGDSDDLRAARFRLADRRWLDENYVHPATDDDWLDGLLRLGEARSRMPLPLRREARGAIGGPLRRAWDRKRVLGSYDRSVLGALAFGIGTPARWVSLRLRAVRCRIRGPIRDLPDRELQGGPPHQLAR